MNSILEGARLVREDGNRRLFDFGKASFCRIQLANTGKGGNIKFAVGGGVVIDTAGIQTVRAELDEPWRMLIKGICSDWIISAGIFIGHTHLCPGFFKVAGFFAEAVKTTVI